MQGYQWLHLCEFRGDVLCCRGTMRQLIKLVDREGLGLRHITLKPVSVVTSAVVLMVLVVKWLVNGGVQNKHTQSGRLPRQSHNCLTIFSKTVNPKR